MRGNVLLTAADWQSRTLILAELQEAGHEVMAVPGLHYAVAAIIKGLIEPSLVLLDVHGDDYATPTRVQRLMELTPDASFILIVPAHYRTSWRFLEERGARVLARPISVGQVIKVVEETLAERQKAGDQAV